MTSKYDQKDLELKKHVGSIHCSNTLSLLQRKISNILLYHAYAALLEKDEHEISIKTLCQLIGYDSNDYATIKKALKALISTVLEWNLLGDTKHLPTEDWNASSILASVGIKGGVCTYSYSPKMKKLLYMPEIYGRINISVQANFKSNYALALYENSIRYQNLSYTRWFSFATFRKLMGVPENKYTVFRDFKRRVLDKAVSEINQYAEITIASEIEREGHKVVRIRFRIQNKEGGIGDFVTQRQVNRMPFQNQDLVSESTTKLIKCGLNENPYPQEQTKILDKLMICFGLDFATASKILGYYHADFVAEKIRVVESSRAFQNGKVKNLAAYLYSALKENYQLGQSQNQVVKSRKTHANNVEQQKIDEELMKKKYSEYTVDLIESEIGRLNEEKKQQLEVIFEQHLKEIKNSFVLQKFQQKRLEDKIVKSVYRNFIKEQFPELINQLISYEHFIQQYQVEENRYLEE